MIMKFYKCVLRIYPKTPIEAFGTRKYREFSDRHFFIMGEMPFAGIRLSPYGLRFEYGTRASRGFHTS